MRVARCVAYRCDIARQWTLRTCVAVSGRWADRRGNHHHAFDASAIDVLAIYCPSPRTFVYLLADELPPAHVNLLLSRARNGQVRRTRDASAYRDPWRMFGPADQAGGAAPDLATVGDG